MTKEELLKQIKVNNYLEWSIESSVYSIFLINKKDLFINNDNISVRYSFNKIIPSNSIEMIEDNPSHLIFERNERGDCTEVSSEIEYIKCGEEVIYEGRSSQVEVQTLEDIDELEEDLSGLYKEGYTNTDEPNNSDTEWYNDFINSNKNETSSSNDDFVYKISSEYLKMAETAKPNNSDISIKSNADGLEIKISVNFK